MELASSKYQMMSEISFVIQKRAWPRASGVGVDKDVLAIRPGYYYPVTGSRCRR